VKKPIAGRDGIDVRFRCRGGNSVRGFYFKIAAVYEEPSCCLNDLSSLPKRLLPPGKPPIPAGDR
jgi:hypothetical protein